jgi:hypothetical protein
LSTFAGVHKVAFRAIASRKATLRDGEGSMPDDLTDEQWALIENEFGPPSTIGPLPSSTTLAANEQALSSLIGVMSSRPDPEARVAQQSYPAAYKLKILAKMMIPLKMTGSRTEDRVVLPPHGIRSAGALGVARVDSSETSA